MKRLSNGTVLMELKQESVDQGYTMRANINASAIRAFKQWNKDSAKIIRRAMRHGDCKTVIAEMQNAKWRNREIREIAAHHDKIVYDSNGQSIALWDCDEQKMYELEH